MAIKRMNIKVAEDMHEWIQKEAENRGLTMNAVVVFALETYQTQREVVPNLGKMQMIMEQLEKAK